MVVRNRPIHHSPVKLPSQDCLNVGIRSSSSGRRTPAVNQLVELGLVACLLPELFEIPVNLRQLRIILDFDAPASAVVVEPRQADDRFAQVSPRAQFSNPLSLGFLNFSPLVGLRNQLPPSGEQFKWNGAKKLVC